MSQGSTYSSGSGPDFHLPDEVLAVIPTDPYDQLDLARKITSMAIASRVSNLESDMGRMRQKLYEKDRLIIKLEERVSGLNHVHQEADSRLKDALDENIKLSNERDQLAVTAKKLSRDLAKLETFKRQLMQSLNDDNSSQAETIDIGTCEQPVPKAYPDKEKGANGYVVHHSYNSSTDRGSTIDEASRYDGQRFSLTPYVTPRLTPTGTPKVISTTGSPRRYSAVGSPQRSSSTTSPTKHPYEGQTSLSSWYPSSQQSSAANSPPRGRPPPGRTPRIDGKEFFRQARSRLSYEQFSAFLANVKELNAQKQTRGETLRKAEEIFGTDNKDLYLSFQGLLNRNVH
ncbi:WAT1-related protein [Quillaja saponaria]|uniref:WAT1-related protein n=1 Tax=Quillaja saponaria TaxID=32244 RepID=A0AAD7QIH7_QUISA|nr:WAT1-related protein [Quillaja saponaria]